jgi:hypothetical protein
MNTAREFSPVSMGLVTLLAAGAGYLLADYVGIGNNMGAAAGAGIGLATTGYMNKQATGSFLPAGLGSVNIRQATAGCGCGCG